MSKKVIWIIVAVVIVIAGAVGVYALMQQNAGAPSKEDSTATPGASSNKPASATITYSDSGYSPKTITVKAGDTVAIKNTTSHDMQFDSDPHPVHTNNPELNVDLVSPGQTLTFTVNTKGTFGYHDHLNPSDTGTIIVE